MNLANSKKLAVWFLAGSAGLGATFGLVAKYVNQKSAMGYLGLKNQDVTESFRKTLYRTANTKIVEGQQEQAAAQAGVRRDQYDSSMILFGKPDYWSDPKAQAKVDKAEDARRPIDLVKKEFKPVVSTKLVATLEDMGVNMKRETLPPLSDGFAGQEQGKMDSVRLAGPMKELKNAKPMTEQEARFLSQKTRSNVAKSDRDANARVVRASVSGQRGREIALLRASARMGQYAVSSGDMDSISLLGGAAVASGADIGPAVMQMADRGELGDMTARDVKTITEDFFAAIGLGADAAGDGKGGDAGGFGGGRREFSSSFATGGDLSLDFLSGSGGASDAICPVCKSVSLDPGLVIGPPPPAGPSAVLGSPTGPAGTIK